MPRTRPNYPMTQAESDAWEQMQGGSGGNRTSSQYMPGASVVSGGRGNHQYGDPLANYYESGGITPGGGFPGQTMPGAGAPPPTSGSPSNFAPTSAQVGANPGQYANTSFDPSIQISNQPGMQDYWRSLTGNAEGPAATLQPGQSNVSTYRPAAPDPFQQWMNQQSATLAPEYRLGGQDELRRNVLAQIQYQNNANPGSVSLEQAQQYMADTAAVNRSLAQQREALRSGGNLNGGGYGQVQLPNMQQPMPPQAQQPEPNNAGTWMQQPRIPQEAIYGQRNNRGVTQPFNGMNPYAQQPGGGQQFSPFGQQQMDPRLMQVFGMQQPYGGQQQMNPLMQMYAQFMGQQGGQQPGRGAPQFMGQAQQGNMWNGGMQQQQPQSQFSGPGRWSYGAPSMQTPEQFGAGGGFGYGADAAKPMMPGMGGSQSFMSPSYNTSAAPGPTQQPQNAMNPWANMRNRPPARSTYSSPWG